MVSPAKAHASQLNAQKSTGPRTPEGRRISSMNARRHGIFARHLLLPGEDATELSRLKIDTIRRFNPRCSVELRVVERIVTALWKLSRLQRFEQASYYQASQNLLDGDPELRESNGIASDEPLPAELVRVLATPAEQANFDRMEMYEYRLENSLHRAIRQLQRLQDEPPSEELSEAAQSAVAAEPQPRTAVQNEASTPAPTKVIHPMRMAAPTPPPRIQKMENEATAGSSRRLAMLTAAVHDVINRVELPPIPQRGAA